MRCAIWSLMALVACLAVGAECFAQEVKPLPPREGVEWLNITSYDANKTDLPRVLIIGDSITSRYSGTVNSELKGKAYLTSMSTSKAVGDPALLDEIKTACNQYEYAVVHFNIGLHGGGGVPAYQKGFPEMVATIRAHAPGAKLIWATTTPCQGEGGMTQNARAFNKIAAEYVEKEKIPVDDLYGLVMSNMDKPELLWDGSGIHFTEEGSAVLGKQVAQSILKELAPAAE